MNRRKKQKWSNSDYVKQSKKLAKWILEEGRYYENDEEYNQAFKEKFEILANIIKCTDCQDEMTKGYYRYSDRNQNILCGRCFKTKIRDFFCENYYYYWKDNFKWKEFINRNDKYVINFTSLDEDSTINTEPIMEVLKDYKKQIKRIATTCGYDIIVIDSLDINALARLIEIKVKFGKIKDINEYQKPIFCWLQYAD